MKFLLIINHDDLFAHTESILNNIGVWIKKMEQRGVRVYGNSLRPPSEAANGRVREGKIKAINGPVANSKEKMCAYELIKCSSFEQAIEFASPFMRVLRTNWRDPGWSPAGFRR
jgi:hypothetical protein